MSDAPTWERDGQDWPNRTASRFVSAGGLRWHVQVAGHGPVLLLLHGTGAATHSWRDLLPLLAARFTVVAPDLPGHGFTSAPARAEGLSLPGMAAGVAALLAALGHAPDLVAGHSAGAAILADMVLAGQVAPRGLVGLNPAILPLPGLPSSVFSPVARLMARLPVIPWLFAWRAADPRVMERLLRGTGSVPDAAGVRFYARLARRPGHAQAALGMMAQWDLPALQPRLPALTLPVLLLVGAQDRTIPPSESRRLRALLPQAELVEQPGLGHLAHEEAPSATAALIAAFAHRCGLP